MSNAAPPSLVASPLQAFATVGARLYDYGHKYITCARSFVLFTHSNLVAAAANSRPTQCLALRQQKQWSLSKL